MGLRFLLPSLFYFSLVGFTSVFSGFFFLLDSVSVVVIYFGDYVILVVSKFSEAYAALRLFYDHRGLDKYYGLLELGELGGMWKNVAGRYEMTVNGETKKVYAKAILKDPEVYFTEEVMQQLDAAAKKGFSYG